MRLLKEETGGKFSLHEYDEKRVPKYAILSHTWESDRQEVVFEDILNSTGKNKTGYRKIAFCAKQAAEDEIEYFWVDSCCIDKTNSTELTNAINSMLRWYRNASKCYVYLADVPGPSNGQWQSASRCSRWFTRGWTLQELLAPRAVILFARTGEEIGTKATLEKVIQQITGYQEEALRGAPLTGFSLSDIRSWSAGRQTTVEVDQIYCLFGIYDIFLPLIYGETKANAERRFAEEVEKRLGPNTPGALYEQSLLRQLKIRSKREVDSRATQVYGVIANL
jgi:hypothetical protein